MNPANPKPISTNSINLIIQHIAPPSHLPLPPHLISKSLLQRHHFLGLHPNDPLEYLCWPSSSRDQTIQLLESHLSTATDDPETPPYIVRYSSDTEQTYAHVNINKGKNLRLVFDWDDQDGWKYHDATVMPFPANTHSTVDEALSSSLLNKSDTRSSATFLGEHTPSPKSEEHMNPSDDDAYWDAYDQDDDDEANFTTYDGKKADVQNNTEDAYWAQYASVQGTADSTIPSPLHSNSKIKRANDSSHEQDTAAFSYPMNGAHDSELDLPSPNTLVERLHVLTRRERSRSLSPPLHEPVVDAATSSPPSGLVSNEGSSKSNSGPVHLPTTQDAPPNLADASARLVETDDEAALRETIGAVYRLWKTGRSVGSSNPSRSASKRDTFLRIVHEAVSSS